MPELIAKDLTKPTYIKPLPVDCINARPTVSKDAMGAILAFEPDEPQKPLLYNIQYSVSENKDGANVCTKTLETQTATDAFIDLLESVNAQVVGVTTEERSG